MIKSNFHTHTIYCDGENTPEEMVLSAIQKGFTSLGFSGHGQLIGGEDWSMSGNVQKQYRNAVNQVTQKYASKIKVYCGLEQDLFSDKPLIPTDYIIGSVHRINYKGIYIDVDYKASVIEGVIKELFDGNFNVYAKHYYEHVKRLSNVELDVVGHFDIVTKFNEILGITLNDEYYEYAENAVKLLAKLNKPFEINTGAMARGYKTSPYPDAKILKMIKDCGGSIMINSDCHNKDFLDFGFSNVYNLAKSIGFTKHAVILDDGINYLNFE